ncbi:MAG: biopolymer transporter ExbD [Pontiellaceae bacterium]|nr:biopolymer transporter ExbD [Pontiellaceae bacterium]
MKLNCGYETKKARVEMLPLIDVVFLLLVFFIYAMISMVTHHGLKVDLPTAGNAVINTDDHITITIDAENRLFLNGDLTAFDDLTEKVLALFAEQSKPVFIDGDQSADLGRALELLDLLRTAGIEEISFSCETSNP